MNKSQCKAVMRLSGPLVHFDKFSIWLHFSFACNHCDFIILWYILRENKNDLFVPCCFSPCIFVSTCAFCDVFSLHLTVINMQTEVAKVRPRPPLRTRKSDHLQMSLTLKGGKKKQWAACSGGKKNKTLSDAFWVLYL